MQQKVIQRQLHNIQNVQCAHHEYLNSWRNKSSYCCIIVLQHVQGRNSFRDFSHLEIGGFNVI